MKISEDKITRIFDLMETVVIDGIKAVYEYQSEKSYLPVYYRYPELFLKGIEETETYKELKENVDTFKYGIPLFHFTNYNTPNNYEDLFKTSDGKYSINCCSLNGFNDLLAFFEENEDVNKMISSEEKYIKTSLAVLVGNIVNRYLHVTKKFKEGDIENDFIKTLVTQQLKRLYDEQLPVDICVPICFLQFEGEEIEIAENISICKMTDEFQISRYKVNNFESTQENHVVQCAGFMIRIKGYMVENREKESLHNAVSNYWAYPTELIDDLFAAIRIVVGYRTGYGQLLIEPSGWAEKWVTNLLPLYGATIRAFNRNETETKMFGFHIETVNEEDVLLIKEIFKIIREKREEEKKSKKNKNEQGFKKVFIAIKRLNRCMLREADDDTALDAIIGIETLLGGNAQGEITYRISNRIAVVAAQLERCPYSSAFARSAMGTIYGLRSDIVHGREQEKNRKINKGEKEILTKELAIEFLRYALLFIIKNQEYLDVKEFENSLDEAVEPSMKKQMPSKNKVD